MTHYYLLICNLTTCAAFAAYSFHTAHYGVGFCLLPCGDIGFDRSEETSGVVSASSHNQDQDEEDICSPFCHCSCCAGFPIHKHHHCLIYDALRKDNQNTGGPTKAAGATDEQLKHRFKMVEVIPGVEELVYAQISLVKELQPDTKIVSKGAFYIWSAMQKTETEI